MEWERERIQELIKKYGYWLQDIFNMEHLTKSQENNWDSIINITQRHGWPLISIKTGFRNGINNSKQRTKKYFFCRITFPVILFFPTYKTSVLKTSSQTLLHMSNQKTKELSAASRLLHPGPNGSELPRMSLEWAGTWPQLMCCASVLSLSLICGETKVRV